MTHHPTNGDQSNTSTQCWNCKTVFNSTLSSCPRCGANGLSVSYQPNPYAKNYGDYPEEVRIQWEQDSLAANSNVQKMQIANSNAKAGSEELIIRKVLQNYRQDVARLVQHQERYGDPITPETLEKLDNDAIALIAQSSAQAEMRGRVDELKWALEAAGGCNIAIKERLAQLRAQGGEKS